MRILRALALAVVWIPVELGADCVLDQAHAIFVPPSTVRVVASYACGAIMCWERWAEVDGRRVGVSRACETSKGGDATDQITVP